MHNTTQFPLGFGVTASALVARSFRLTSRLAGHLTLVALALGPFFGANAIWADEQVIHVAPAPVGDDRADGLSDKPEAGHGPVATLTAARDLARTIRKAGGSRGVRVQLAAGTYSLDQPLELNDQDGGTQVAPTVYQARSGEEVIISGGRVIQGLNVDGQGIWHAHVPEGWRFEQLWVNGVRARRSQWPNSGYASLDDVHEEVLEKGQSSVPLKSRITLKMPESLGPRLAGRPAEELSDSVLLFFHNWDTTRYRLESVSPDGRNAVHLGVGLKPWNPIKKGCRFLLENAPVSPDGHELQAGDWHLSRAGELLYRPRSGESPERSTLIAPVSEQLIRIIGTSEKPVEHLRFEGLTFAYTGWRTPPRGLEPMQSAANIGAVIEADHATDLYVQRCTIEHTGLFGLWLKAGCQGDVVTHCRLADLGAGGVRIGLTKDAREVPETGPEVTERNQVDHCMIRVGGRVFPQAAGVLIGQSGANVVTHNDISDLFYTGVSAGWTWGYGPSRAHDNQITYNHIHIIGQKVLSDMGGVYTLGKQPGTLIAHNLIHDVDDLQYGGWGIYNDEGSSNILVENNLVHHTDDGGYIMHYGEQNLIRNNIFALATKSQLYFAKPENHLSFTFERNIVYMDSGYLLHGCWNQATAKYAIDSNLYWDARGRAPEFDHLPLEKWQARDRDRHSLIADPGFANPAKLDFTLPSDSVARKIGFVPFDPSEAGLNGEEVGARGKAK